jgi:hypothetical protein
MGISLANGVSASPGYTAPTWPTNISTATGLVSTGAYGKYLPGCQVVSASSVKSHVLQAADNLIQTNLDSIALPANFVGPDGWYELDVIWGCNSSANVKSMTPLLNWSTSYPTTGNIGQDSQTTNTTNRFTVKIFNRNNTSSQVMFPSVNTNNSTNPVFTAALDLSGASGALNTIALVANVQTAGGSDSVWVESWTLKAYNPPVYSGSRLNFGTQQFYGVNGHYDDSQSIAQHISDMKVMGFKTLRITYEGGTSLTTLVQYAQAIQADNTGIQMMCTLDFSYTSDGVNIWPSEQAAYNYAYTTAQTVCQALAPYGVYIYECGNEMDTKQGINIGDPQGGYARYYSTTVVPILRGIMRGGIDGVHATGSQLALPLLAASNAFTTCAIGLSDMLWNGLNPDGTPSPTGPLRWDITSWHNYEDYGPMMSVEANNQGAYINLWEHLNRTYNGIPIIVTEWNGKSSDTDAQRAAWANRWLGEAYNNRYKYNIAFVCVYELYGSPWQVMASAGVPVSTFGTTIQTFITNNPDPAFNLYLMSGSNLLLMSGGNLWVV